MTFAPHEFIPHPNQDRIKSCVKCGRAKDHKVHYIPKIIRKLREKGNG